MFDWFYNIFGTVMTWCYDLTNNYALALLFFAVIIKVLMLPFGIKQQKSQIALAKLRPKVAKIEKRYAGRNDRVTLQKKQQEIMELQQKEGYSPLSGCLPLLIQLPIIFGLYSVIRRPLSFICKLSDEAITKMAEMLSLQNINIKNDQISVISAFNSASGELKGSIASAIDGFEVSSVPNFSMFGLDLAAKPSFTALSLLVLIPFIAGASQYLSMVITRKFSGNTQLMQTTPEQKKSMIIMDITMPLMSVFLAFTFPAALGLYWTYQAVISIIQVILLNKLMPMPHYTEEELREIEKMQKAQRAAQRAAVNSQPRVKSLHHIDDDDYDELPEIKGQPKGEKNGSIELGDLKDRK